LREDARSDYRQLVFWARLLEQGLAARVRRFVRSRDLFSPRHRNRPPPEREVPRASRDDEPRPPPRQRGEARRGAAHARRDLPLVHRRVRHYRSERREGATRRAVELTDEACAARPAETRIATVRSSAAGVALRFHRRARSVATKAATAATSTKPIGSSLKWARRFAKRGRPGNSAYPRDVRQRPARNSPHKRTPSYQGRCPCPESRSSNFLRPYHHQFLIHEGETHDGSDPSSKGR
jgi:hypothetical protein